MRIFTLDTTLRDGTQGEQVTFSVKDKLLIAQKLDEFGIDYIEGGWPASNPKDVEFFRLAREHRFAHARLAAFGSTRFSRNAPENDPGLKALLEAQTPTVTIFGQSWDYHVHAVTGLTARENLEIIADTVRYLKSQGREVIFDAQHFFDGYQANPEFALGTLEAARRAGADVVCLCDTNGGTLTRSLAEMCAEVRRRIDGVLGIHTHNDADLAVSNTLAAVEQGFSHVQGCLNGYGERCGNAKLASVIANLELKLGHETVGRENLGKLSWLVRFIAELANTPVPSDQPYVGQSAFAHKSTVHVRGALSTPGSYEHVRPASVGNRERVLLSDLSEPATILRKLSEHEFAAVLTDKDRRELVDCIQMMEYEGFDLESAGGTLELLVRETLNPDIHFFEVAAYEVTIRRASPSELLTTATVSVRVHDTVLSATAGGNGPINALDQALRSSLAGLYPKISSVRVTDYRVRVLEPHRGTAAKVRVLVDSTDGARNWTTVGVSGNLIEASWLALVDSIRLALLRLGEEDQTVAPMVIDNSWAV